MQLVKGRKEKVEVWEEETFEKKYLQLGRKKTDHPILSIVCFKEIVKKYGQQLGPNRPIENIFTFCCDLAWSPNLQW